MSRALTSSPTWLHRKMCLSCGFDGKEIQGDREPCTFSCPSCGSDLYARPPRSYAAMEGFAGPAPADGAPELSVSRRQERRRRKKWHRGAARFESMVVWSIGVLLLMVVAAGVVQDLLART